MKRSPVKTAVIGVGRWGKNVARELEVASELTAYAHQGSEDAEAWAKEHLPNAARMSVEDIAVDSSITAVAIATPISTHEELARRMLATGKHVFVEKPLAEHAAAAAALSALASEKGLVLITGYVFLHHPVYAELKRRIDGTTITDLTLTWKKHGTFGEPIELNLLTHHLSIALDLMGMPEKGTLARGKGVESACDQLDTVLSYPSGTVRSAIDRASSEKSHVIEAKLADGRTYRWIEDKLYENDGAEPAFVNTEPPLAREMAAFLDAASGGAHPDPTFGARVLELHELIS